MAKMNFKASIKHVQIDKANTMMIVAAAITTSVVVFSLIAANSLYKQMTYQNKVISLRNKANKQLEKNIEATKQLIPAYETFDNSGESVIGTADKNSKVVLDALPSKYDFPALATSIEGIIKGSGATPTGITGTDAEESAEQDSVSPKPIDIPIQFSATGNSASIQRLITDLQRSIRPIKITQMVVSGNDNNMQINVTALTFYQPEKKLEIQQKMVPQTNTTTKKGSNK